VKLNEWQIVDEDGERTEAQPLRIGRRALVGAVAAVGAAVALGGFVLPILEGTPSSRRVFKVVFLFTAINDPAVQVSIGTVKQSLRDLGYIEDQHIVYDGRSAERVPERFPGLAREVVAMAPDVIVCQNPRAANALKAETKTIPIVFVGIGVDAVESGIVSSLSKPEANLTGLSSAGAGIYAKRLELLKGCAPRISRVALLRDPGEPPQALAEMRAAAPSLGLQVLPVDIGTPADLEPGLAAAVTSGADALVHSNTALFVVGTQVTPWLVEFALRNRWPSSLDPAAGGLLSYAGVLNDPWRRAANGYIDRILKGARPGDLPVEGPTGSKFVINMCTAAKLGLDISPTVIAQANEVIQCVQR